MNSIFSEVKNKISIRIFIISIAIISFLTVILINQFIFPYYSNNHDEGVYIFQAKMLAEGNIYVKNNNYDDFFDAWFIINDGEKIYPKYAPIHSMILSIFYILFGNMSLALGTISGLNLTFIYLITKKIYDANIAKIASITCLVSPMFIIISSTYLSYTSSFLLSLIFIYSFIVSLNNDNKKYYLISGISLGLLFFSRTYDGILIGLPFMTFLFYKTITEREKYAKKLYFMTISFLPIFIIMLSYNYILTNNPFLFPFNKYEPLDTLGFGTKRMSLYGPSYLFTIDTAIDATKTFLYNLFFNWTLTGIFFIGFIFLIFIKERRKKYETLFLALFALTIIGNFIFWGPYNFLNWKNSIDTFGPIYYFNLLLPLSMMTGKVINYISNLIRSDSLTVMRVILTIVIIVNILLIIPKIELNYKYTEKNEKLYSPIINGNISNSLIFLPTPYGPYIHHPFGYLINDPSFNESIIYARNLGNRNIQLMEKYRDRNYYLYEYDGKYTESYDDQLVSRLIKLNLIEDKVIKIGVSMINPTDKKFVFSYIWNGGNINSYILDNDSQKGKYYNMTWYITPNNTIMVGNYLHDNVRSLFKLDNSTSLTISSAFSNSSSLSDPKEIYEYRYKFDINDENIMLLTPPESWKNEEYSRDYWKKTNITAVLSINYD